MTPNVSILSSFYFIFCFLGIFNEVVHVDIMWSVSEILKVYNLNFEVRGFHFGGRVKKSF